MSRAGPVLAAPLPEPAWGGLVAAYLVVIGLPSGLGLLTWWLTTHGAAGAAWFERRAGVVALAAIGGVGALLTVDLGRSGGFYLMVTRFELTSPISVGAKLVAAKAALLALALYAGERHRRIAATVPSGATAPVAARSGATRSEATRSGATRSEATRSGAARSGAALSGVAPAGARSYSTAALQPVTRTLVAVVSFALAIYPAALLSRTWSSPLGATSGAALLFLTTSLLLGAAAAVVIVLAGPPRHRPGASAALPVLRRVLLALLTGHAIALLFQALAAAGEPRLSGAVAALTTGQYAGLWWAGAVAAGVVVPLAVLVLWPRRDSAVLLAAFGAAAGAGVTRYLLFAAGG